MTAETKGKEVDPVTENRSLKAKLGRRDAKIAELEARLAEAEAQAARNQNRAVASEHRNSELARLQLEMTTERNRLQGKISSQQDQISKLQAELRKATEARYAQADVSVWAFYKDPAGLDQDALADFGAALSRKRAHRSG